MPAHQQNAANLTWPRLRQDALDISKSESLLTGLLQDALLQHQTSENALSLFLAGKLASRDLAFPFLFFKGFQALQSYHVAHWLWNQGRMPLALCLESRISEAFDVDIHPAARIGEGILIDHGTGVVVGKPRTANPALLMDQVGEYDYCI